MARIFVYDNREFPDPDPSGEMPVDEVRQMLADHMPELNNAEVREEQRGDDKLFVFTKRIGTKGLSGADVAAILKGVPQNTLQVFALAEEFIDAHGEINYDAVGARKREVNLAIVEAESYAKATERARKAVLRTRFR